MEPQKLSRNLSFWPALGIIIVTVAMAVANYYGLLELRFRVGPFFIGHWFGWTGAVIIAVGTPIYSYLKRRLPQARKLLSDFHMFGNLVAFMLIAIHFSQQMSRPAESFPALGTGLALFIAVSILVTTGILQRFRVVERLAGYYRLLHVGAAMTFYITVVIHILHGMIVI